MKSSCKWPIGCEAWRNRTKEIILRLSNKYYISFFFFPQAFVQGMNFDISKLVCSFKVPELERAPLTQVDNNLTAGQEVDEGYSSFQNKLTHGIPSLLAFHSGLFCLDFIIVGCNIYEVWLSRHELHEVSQCFLAKTARLALFHAVKKQQNKCVLIIHWSQISHMTVFS